MTRQPNQDTIRYAECLQVARDFEQLAAQLQDAINGLKRQPLSEMEIRALERALEKASLGAELARKLARSQKRID